MTGSRPAGLPHSAISGSPRVCHSPELLAAYHGLPRLRVPRHPPHAFLRLTTKTDQAELTRIASKRVTFSCEKVISIKDSSIPRSTIHPLSNSDDPQGPKAKGSTIESGWTECVEAKRLRDVFTHLGVSYSRSVKEVIQPQVPLRLPCYDFAPVTALAFGRLVSLRSSDTDFGRSQLPWRDGRCVQGPGTYSPWRS